MKSASFLQSSSVVSLTCTFCSLFGNKIEPRRHKVTKVHGD